ncbi:MAG: GNAT family N-acetyltransferase [Dehalococcoidia bacterium]|nr:GNAT family N-acetyltransferase [Dehalococcoidia bacterium]
MKDILVREATESDLPVIGKLLEDLTDAMDNTEGIDTGIALKTCQYLLNDDSSHFLVAAMEGTPVGFMNFTVRQTILHRSPSGLIDELVVAEGYRSKGVGKQLVLAAVEKCRQLGCCEVEASTEKTNLEAREFYKQCGFEERGTLFEVDLQLISGMSTLCSPSMGDQKV